EGVRALRAERPLVDRAARVALDVDELSALCVDELAAPDGAVRADPLGDRRPAKARGLRGRLWAERLGLGRDRQAEHWNLLRGEADLENRCVDSQFNQGGRTSPS